MEFTGNKFEFIMALEDAFSGLTSNEEIEQRAEEMMRLLESQKELSKLHLQAGLL